MTNLKPGIHQAEVTGVDVQADGYVKHTISIKIDKSITGRIDELRKFEMDFELACMLETAAKGRVSGIFDCIQLLKQSNASTRSVKVLEHAHSIVIEQREAATKVAQDAAAALKAKGLKS